MTSIVYMVAGMSSRFGGKIKQFAKVGINGETLIEVSMKQAISAGVNKIIFIVGEKTEIPFKEKFGDSFNGVPLFYAKQSFDPLVRDKPWGTVDALISANQVIDEDFIVCNGDDLYGDKALTQAINFLKNNKSDSVSIGYKLGKVIPDEGKVNRGIFETDANGNILKLTEVFEIEKAKLVEKNLNDESLCSMNLFGLRKNVFDDLSEILINFKETHAGDRKIECLLPNELSKLINEKKLQMALVGTDDDWFGVTNPEDEAIIREKLSVLASKWAY